MYFFQDALGNKVWICPSCKGPDDGRPMIGCDDCDAWYHWYVLAFLSAIIAVEVQMFITFLISGCVST